MVSDLKYPWATRSWMGSIGNQCLQVILLCNMVWGGTGMSQQGVGVPVATICTDEHGSPAEEACGFELCYSNCW